MKPYERLMLWTTFGWVLAHAIENLGLVPW